MNSLPVIAIVGMPGSGKSVFTKFFIDKGWSSIYFGHVTLQEVEKRGMQITAENEKKVREEIRLKDGIDAYAKILLPEIEALSQKGPLVLDGLYSWSEYTYLKKRLVNLKVIAVISDSNQRYERLGNREIRSLTLTEAIGRDYAEIENIEKGGPIAIADYYVLNNESLDNLVNQFNMIYHKFV